MIGLIVLNISQKQNKISNRKRKREFVKETKLISKVFAKNKNFQMLRNIIKIN